MTDLRWLLDEHQVLLAEGAVSERLRKNKAVQLDACVAGVKLVDDRVGRLVLGRIYRQYLDIGKAAGLPMIILTPTERASAERTRLANVSLDLNRTAYRMLTGIREHYGLYARLVAVGGLVGPKSERYRPLTTLSADQAMEYHQPQVEILAYSGVDFIFGAGIQSTAEAAGIARAATDCGIPYLLGFLLRPDGAVLDGTLLQVAIRELDNAVKQRPVGYLASCVHPDTFRLAADQLPLTAEARLRLLGLQANTGWQSRAGDVAVAGEVLGPAEFGRQMAELRKDFGLKILGGCCGTDSSHIKAVAEALAARPGIQGQNPAPPGR